jgi:hypothetical protein
VTQLIGLANNTKWNELQTALSSLGVKAPYWRTMSTNGYLYPPTGWDADWTWHFRLGEYKPIEWCELSPRASADSMTLEEIADLVKKCGFEFHTDNGLVKIIAYVRRE